MPENKKHEADSASGTVRLPHLRFEALREVDVDLATALTLRNYESVTTTAIYTLPTEADLAQRWRNLCSKHG